MRSLRAELERRQDVNFLELMQPAHQLKDLYLEPAQLVAPGRFPPMSIEVRNEASTGVFAFHPPYITADRALLFWSMSDGPSRDLPVHYCWRKEESSGCYASASTWNAGEQRSYT